MLNSAHKRAYLQALDGVDHEIDRLTLGSKQHTAAARAAMNEESPEHEAGEDPSMEKAEHEVAGVDPHTGEKNPSKTHYQHGGNYEGKGSPGGHTEHPFGRRGEGGNGLMSRKPLFGKRFAPR